MKNLPIINRIKNFKFYSAKGSKTILIDKFNTGTSTRYWIEIPFIIGFTISIKN